MRQNTETRTAIIDRLDAIEADLARERRNYEGSARCSAEHTMAFTRIHSLESERSMLEAELDLSRCTPEAND